MSDDLGACISGTQVFPIHTNIRSKLGAWPKECVFVLAAQSISTAHVCVRCLGACPGFVIRPILLQFTICRCGICIHSEAPASASVPIVMRIVQSHDERPVATLCSITPISQSMRKNLGSKSITGDNMHHPWPDQASSVFLDGHFCA